MIENRLRLEREIFKGRRAVRRLIMQTSREPITATDFDAGHLPDLSMGPALSPGFEHNGSSWPMDTDIEVPVRVAGRTAKLHFPASGGSRFDGPELHSSGTATPLELQGSADPLRSITRRKAWTSKLLSGSGDALTPGESGRGQPQQDYGLGTPDPLPPDEPEAASTAMSPSKQRFMRFPHLSAGMFRHMRSGALGRLAKPFSPKPKSEDGEDDAQGSNWSSDSSELDDDLDVAGGDFRENPFAGPTMSSSREM